MASLVDWDKYAAPPITMAPGLSALAQALEEVQQRREAKAAAQAKADAELRDKLMVDQRERERMAETERHNREGEGNATANLEQNQARLELDKTGRMLPYIQSGDAPLAKMLANGFGPPKPPGYPTGQQAVDDLLAGSTGIIPPGPASPPASAGPPPAAAPQGRAAIEPPPFGGNAQLPYAAYDNTAQQASPPPGPAPAPAPPQRPPLDPIDAVMQQVETARDAKRQKDISEFTAAMGDQAKASPFAQQAYDYAVAAGKSGALGKETMAAAFERRRHELEQAASNEKVAHIRAQGYMSPELRKDAANRADLARLDNEYNNFRATVDWKGLVTGGRALHAATENLASDSHTDALKHKDAMIQLGRYFRGSTPTEGEMHILYNDLGGRLGNALPKFINRMANGDLTPAEMAQLRESSKTARSAWEHNRDAAARTARRMFGPGSGLEHLSTNVNAKLGGAFEQLDLDMPDIFTTPEGSGVTLGSGKRPTAAGKAAGPKTTLDDHESEADALLKRLRGQP